MRNCDECDMYKAVNDKGFYCCKSCGICDFDYMLPDVYDNDTIVYSKPSVHNRRKWMIKLLERKRALYDDNQIDVIAYDFLMWSIQ